MSTEKPQKPINPYASPQPLARAAEDILVAEAVPFGLQGPLRASGTFTPEQMRHAVRLLFGKRLRRSQLSMVLGLLLLNWICWSFFLLVLTVACVALLGLSEVEWHMRVRRSIWDLCGREMQLLASEQGMQGTSAITHYCVDWSYYVRAAWDEDLVVLLVATGLFHPLPRAFFATASDWYQFLALVKHKLPGEGKRAGVPAESHGAGPALPEAFPEGTLRGAGRLQSRDVQVALRHCSAQRWLRRLYLSTIPLPLVPWLFQTAWYSFLDVPSLAMAWAGVGFLAFLILFTQRRQLRRLERAGQMPFNEQVWAVTEETFGIFWSQGRSTLHWPYLAGYCLAPDCLLLYTPSRSAAYILPRRCFSEADWPKVLELVARKLPRI